MSTERAIFSIASTTAFAGSPGVDGNLKAARRVPSLPSRTMASVKVPPTSMPTRRPCLLMMQQHLRSLAGVDPLERPDQAVHLLFETDVAPQVALPQAPKRDGTVLDNDSPSQELFEHLRRVEPRVEDLHQEKVAPRT